MFVGRCGGVGVWTATMVMATGRARACGGRWPEPYVTVTTDLCECVLERHASEGAWGAGEETGVESEVAEDPRVRVETERSARTWMGAPPPPPWETSSGS